VNLLLLELLFLLQQKADYFLYITFINFEL
jgi:hypothetical protein